MKENTHIGVYGVVEQDGKVLMIKKTRGAYKGQYDLPGGGIKFRESIEDALRREFMEEVGVEIETIKALENSCKTSIWNNNADDVETHHIGMYYRVTIKPGQAVKTEPDGHDSAGCEWIEKDQLTDTPVASILIPILALIQCTK
ncbi:MAG: NUDIX domain-containing protein [Candidatus Gracilibacteria bacterium]